MQKKVVFITGASSGLGLSTAKHLQGIGFKVYGTGRNPKSNQSFELVKMDVRDKKSIENAISFVLSKEKSIDILINNAGIGITGPIEETSTNGMRDVFETNFFGAIETMKAVLPQMRKQKSGLIINVTSIAGYMGLPFRGIYSASKGALELVTESLRMEVKSFGIQITNVAPGDFATNIASGRVTTPVESMSAYAHSYKKSLDLMNTHVDKGDDPIIFAKAIEKIICKKNPAIHYKVGDFLQKFSIILKRVLPDKWYEKMLMNHFNL
ncbi:SDR family oxidoreductase [Namhaeicola litoreus]|uniref:SDR family oxidoreductase n=1 Tax=Namhaeicola litoreus TaxID=1052145 RepID=A0ABW3Y196_9FLAO